MAETNESNTGKGKGSEEIISLEKLVSVEADSPRKSTVAGAPVPPGKSEAKPGAAPAQPPAGAVAETDTPLSDDLDRLFALEDPAFADSLKDLSDLKPGDENEAVDDSDLDTVVDRERREAAVKGPRRLYLLFVVHPLRYLLATSVVWKTKASEFRKRVVPAVKEGAKTALSKMKTGAVSVGSAIASSVRHFSALPASSKFLFALIFILAAATVVVGRITFERKLLPSFQASYATSFAKIADAEYGFPATETWENLNDSFLHPEHIVLIDRIIANLKSDSPTPNPMTMLELFIETSSQEAAVELRDREAEARDVIGRTLNQMPYDELTTVNGKNKLKIFLRKDLNEMMTKGRIRRVFFKSLVIKP